MAHRDINLAGCRPLHLRPFMQGFEHLAVYKIHLYIIHLFICISFVYIYIVCVHVCVFMFVLKTGCVCVFMYIVDT